jgi:hypothetical protein
MTEHLSGDPDTPDRFVQLDDGDSTSWRKASRARPASS